MNVADMWLIGLKVTIGFIVVILLLLVIQLICAISVRKNANENKFIKLLPWWVIGYYVSFAIVFVLLFFSLWELRKIVIGLSYVSALFFALLLVATLVVTIIKKQYKNAIKIVIMGIIMPIYMCLVLFAAFGCEGIIDNFGKRHPTPDGLEYYTTIIKPEYRYTAAQTYLDSLVVERGIVVVDYGQPGQYRYMANVPAIPEKGKIYLKLYEATTNLPLSEHDVKTSTTLLVEPSDTSRIYKMTDKEPNRWNDTDEFTIHEGSWGDYYAARVELWYQPESGSEEQLLHSVIYQIEGWSR